MEEEIEVSEEEKAKWTEVFELFDDLDDGTITTDRLGTVMRELGCVFTEEQLKKMINEVDADGNGTIDFDEFTMVMLKYPPKEGSPEELQELTEALSFFDFNNDGSVSKRELRHYLTSMGEKLTDEELDEFLKCIPG